MHLVNYNKIVYQVKQGMKSGNNIKLLDFSFRARTQTEEAAVTPVSVCVFAYLQWLEDVKVVTEFKSVVVCNRVKNTVEILEAACLSETSVITNFTRYYIRKNLLRV